MLSIQLIYSQDLNQYRWKSRILIVCGNPASNEFQLQVERFNAKELATKMDERKLILIEKLNSNTTCPSEDFSIQLYGLDGGMKLVSDDLVYPIDIFDLIDSMPMRKAEMKRGERP